MTFLFEPSKKLLLISNVLVVWLPRGPGRLPSYFCRPDVHTFKPTTRRNAAELFFLNRRKSCSSFLMRWSSGCRGVHSSRVWDLGCGPVSQCKRIQIINLQIMGDGVSYVFKQILLPTSLPTHFGIGLLKLEFNFRSAPLRQLI